jgi:predicted SAM-dependent methyltransferase
MAYSIPFGPNDTVIELGGGAAPKFRPNVDVRSGETVDKVAALGYEIPYGDGEFSGVYSAYCLEHVSWRNVPKAISEAFRLLAPGGIAVFITSNTEAQMRWALSKEVFDEKISQCLFGDNDYSENTHRAAFNPDYAIRLFREAGFEDVTVIPEGELWTDMIIEARKSMGNAVAASAGSLPIADALRGPDLWTPEQRKLAYNRHYFDGGRGPVGGYAREGYWDYPVHWLTFQKIMELKPESVLEIGCARGYILKRLQDVGVHAEGLEVSRHCILTRVCEGIKEWDITETPWPFKDKEFDLSFSIAVLEHIPKDKVDAVASEIRRVSKRGLHGVDFGVHDDGFDKTHCLFRGSEFWCDTLNGPINGSCDQYKVVEKGELERGPIQFPPADGMVKLNCGSFTTMFHHGWINIDQHPLQEFARGHGYNYLQHDLTKGIPFKDETVDMIHHCHFLEHLTYDQGLLFLKECHRVMKPGALMRILLPDAEKLCQLMASAGLSEFDEISDGCAGSPHQAGKLWALLFSGHSSAYDKGAIYAALDAAGFKFVCSRGFRESLSSKMRAETLDLFPTLSAIVEVVKE